MTLYKTELQNHLTKVGTHDEAACLTKEGQASWAEVPGRGLTCRECIHWQHTPYDYYRGGKNGTLIKPALCAVYTRKTGHKGAKVPDDARACKHFDPNPTPPARYK